MLVRPATRDDIPQLNSVGAAACINDPLDDYLFPKRHAHPARYLKVHPEWIDDALDDSDGHPIVVVLEPNDTGYSGAPTIVGFCEWFRERANKKNQPLFKRIKQGIMQSSAVEILSDLMNPIASARNSMTLNRTQKCIWNDPEYEEPEEYYNIWDLAVHPDFQGRGVAKMMLKWGFDRATEEGVPVCITSSPAARALYGSVGFEGVGWWKWRPEEGTEWELLRWNPPVKSDPEPGTCGPRRSTSRKPEIR